MLPCNWQLIACGINHKTADLRQREPLQIAREELASLNAALSHLDGVKESLILSTCNRVEFYLVADRRFRGLAIVSAFYRESKGLDISGLESCFYTYQDEAAVDHLFRVTAGIDSMVLGENEIVGQAKEAYSSACAVKTAGKVLHGLFHQAFRIGKKVRAETDLGQGACSVSTATIEMIKSKITRDVQPMILMVGLNKMITMATSRLKRRGYDRFLFANRTAQKAVEFASLHDAEGYGLDQLPRLMLRADIIISCTGAPDAVITDSMIAEVVSEQPGKKLIIADMAIPRDVELNNHYPGIDYYDLEDVKQFVKGQQDQRQLAIPDAEEIIGRRLDQFMYWFNHVRHEPMYNGLGDTFEKIRIEEISKLLEVLPADSHDLVDRASRRLVDKLLQIKARTSLSPEKTEY